MNKLADIGTDFHTPSATTSVGSLVTFISSNAVYLAAFVFVILIFIGGFHFISGAGSNDPQQAAQWKKALTYAVVGFVIIFIAYWIVSMLGVLTGISIF